MGVVYHANYIVWMEVGRVEFCRATGLSYRDMERTGRSTAVIEANCRYIAPARYDDEIDIETRIGEGASRAASFHYTMRHAETGQKLAEGFSRHLFLDHDLKPIAAGAFYTQFGLPAGTLIPCYRMTLPCAAPSSDAVSSDRFTWKAGGGSRSTIVAACDLDLASARGRRPRPSMTWNECSTPREPDFLDIATRPELHLPMLRIAADARLPVICQKPMAPRGPIAWRWFASLAAAGIPFMIHENWRWQPWYRVVGANGRGRLGAPGHLYLPHPQARWRSAPNPIC